MVDLLYWPINMLLIFFPLYFFDDFFRTNFIPIAIKFVQVEFLLVEIVLVGDPLYWPLTMLLSFFPLYFFDEFFRTNFIHICSTKIRTSRIRTSGDRTSGRPPVLAFNYAFKLFFHSIFPTNFIPIALKFWNNKIQYNLSIFKFFKNLKCRNQLF